jgi:hypothetical protein
MHFRLYPIFLFILAFATSAAPAFSQAPNDWSSVETISRGTSVFVEKKDGQTQRGKVVSTGPAQLEIVLSGRHTTIQRDEIQRIFRSRKGSRLKRALRGGLIGGLVGVGVLGTYTVIAKADPLIPVAGVLYGVPAGAIIGGIRGGKNRRGVLIYRAP